MTRVEVAHSEQDHWVLWVEFSIQPECAEEFVAIVSDVIDEMRHEENFVTTVLCRDPDKPGRFSLFEIWKSREHFLAVDLSRTYRLPYEARLAAIQSEERFIREWRQIRADYRIGKV